MKIITWNCNMAFRKKAEIVLTYQPDILIIQECEYTGRLTFDGSTSKPTDILWFGANLHKGLAIFSYGDFKLKALDEHNDDFKMIVPIAVTGEGFDFTLFAVWANNPHDPDGQYVEQVWKALHYYDNLLLTKSAVLIGDFNSNSIWDRPRREGNHSSVVRLLAEKEIYSAYHLHKNQEQGRELHPTFYLYRHRDKPYHLDYCFISASLAAKLQALEIGDYDYWIKYSDHMPLMATLI